jgi:hypothetical protein
MFAQYGLSTLSILVSRERKKMKRFIVCALSLLFAANLLTAQAQQASTSGSASGTKKRASQQAVEQTVSTQLSEMKQGIDALQQQVRQLNEQVQSRDQRIQQLEQRLDQFQSTATQAESKADAAAAQSAEQAQTVTALKTDVTDMKANATSAALSLQETQKSLESPLAIHFKGITITPGGFLAAETVWRQHALGADINTPFNSIPFEGAGQSHMSEIFGSGRQSRLSMLAEGKLNTATLRGYVETDFLSAGTTSNNNESNSYSLRARQAWGQAALNSGWTFTGGQMWSLVTETKRGLDNRSEAVPMTIDPQYNIGFSWARQYGFRVTKNFGDKFWAGFSVENSQTTLGGHGAINNFLIGSQGASGGLYNPTANYSFNASPDFIVKVAAEPGWGHYEVFGLVSDFRDRTYPCSAVNVFDVCTGTLANPSNQSKVGGGVGANIRGTLAKKLDLGLHFLGGNGIGRYGTAGLPDVIAEPDGSLTPLRNYQTLATAEFHSGKLDIYANFGSEYESRHWVSGSPLAANFGYGSPLASNVGCGTETLPTATTIVVETPPAPGSTTPGTASIPVPGSVGTPISIGYNPGSLKNCTGDTRNILEGTIGFWYRFYRGPKGTLQWGPQYSYIVRNTWEGIGNPAQGISGDPSAKDGMVLTSFRYYLP